MYSSDDEIEYYTLKCDAEAKRKFLHEPKDWKVVELEPVWQSNMICLQCNRSSCENLLGVMLKDRMYPGNLFIHSVNILHKCTTRSFLIVRYCGSWQKKLLEQLAVKHGVTGLRKNDTIKEIMTKLAQPDPPQ